MKFSYTKEYSRQYYQVHKEHLKKLARIWYNNNKERKKEWRKFHTRPCYTIYEHKRMAIDPTFKTRKVIRNINREIRKRELGGSFTLKEWLDKKKEYYFTCFLCNKIEPEIKLTIDHIIPVSKWKEWIKTQTSVFYRCGDIQNIQPLCGICNRKKYNKVLSFNQL